MPNMHVCESRLLQLLQVSLCEYAFMNGQLRPRVNYVIGPDGSPLTIADLPPPGQHRWVIRRKAEVVAAVRGGLLSLEEACSLYSHRRGIFGMAALNRASRPCRPAHHAHPAISSVVLS
jgi:hypothetical protein